MRVGSLFSGIGGLDHGLHQAGHEHVFFCESDPYRRSVLATRWPGVPVYDDVRLVASDDGAWPAGVGVGRRALGGDNGSATADGSLGGAADVDLLCGGFPCQDLSVAGQRRGLAGNRSGLFFEFARVADALRPRWLLVENVPGLLSSNGGRDFGAVVGTLAELGYGLGWRVLDSRYFGVPQRRRRVFIVGAVADGDPRAAAERAGQVLAVGARCPRHPATRGEAREEPAVASLSGTLGGRKGFTGDDIDRGGTFVTPLSYALGAKAGYHDGDADTTYVANTLKSQDGRGWSHDAEATYVARPLGGGNDGAERSEDDPNLVAYALRKDPGGTGQGHNTNYVQEAASVRRLTPTECERLQALPDDWTQLGGTPDSRRYAALGDAVTASVARWIGERLVAA